MEIGRETPRLGDKFVVSWTQAHRGRLHTSVAGSMQEPLGKRKKGKVTFWKTFVQKMRRVLGPIVFAPSGNYHEKPFLGRTWPTHANMMCIGIVAPSWNSVWPEFELVKHLLQNTNVWGQLTGHPKQYMQTHTERQRHFSHSALCLYGIFTR